MKRYTHRNCGKEVLVRKIMFETYRIKSLNETHPDFPPSEATLGERTVRYTENTIFLCSGCNQRVWLMHIKEETIDEEQAIQQERHPGP